MLLDMIPIYRFIRLVTAVDLVHLYVVIDPVVPPVALGIYIGAAVHLQPRASKMVVPLELPLVC